METPSTKHHKMQAWDGHGGTRLAAFQHKTKLSAQGWFWGGGIPAAGGGILVSWCPCSDPDRQLPTASLVVGIVGCLGWQDSHSHKLALVQPWEGCISSCSATRWVPPWRVVGPQMV